MALVPTLVGDFTKLEIIMKYWHQYPKRERAQLTLIVAGRGCQRLVHFKSIQHGTESNEHGTWSVSHMLGYGDPLHSNLKLTVCFYCLGDDPSIPMFHPGYQKTITLEEEHENVFIANRCWPVTAVVDRVIVTRALPSDPPSAILPPVEEVLGERLGNRIIYGEIPIDFVGGLQPVPPLV